MKNTATYSSLVIHNTGDISIVEKKGTFLIS